MDIVFALDSQEEFETTIKDIVDNYYCWNEKTQTLINPALLEEGRRDIKQLFLDSQFNIDQIPDLLATKGWNEARIEFLSNLLSDNKIDLLYATLITQTIEHGETITNYDWIIKLIMGTSELNTLKYPLLQIILSTENYGFKTKCSYDANKVILLKFINTLEGLD